MAMPGCRIQVDYLFKSKSQTKYAEPDAGAFRKDIEMKRREEMGLTDTGFNTAYR